MQELNNLNLDIFLLNLGFFPTESGEKLTKRVGNTVHRATRPPCLAVLCLFTFCCVVLCGDTSFQQIILKLNENHNITQYLDNGTSL